MDDLDAPQWADFITPSPQLCLDDYFLKKHEKHEYRDKLDTIDSESPNVSQKKLNSSKQPLNESSYNNTSIMQKTPQRSMCAKTSKISNINKKGQIKETTYEKVLSEAMSNLQLSFKSKGDKSINKSCLMDSPIFKTPINRVTRSMCAQASNTSKLNLEKSVKFEDHVHKYCEDDKENVHSEEGESPLSDQTSQIHLEVTVSSSEHEISQDQIEQEDKQGKPAENIEQEKIEPIQIQEVNKPKEIEKVPTHKASGVEQLPKSKVVATFASKNTTAPASGGKKKISALTGTAWHRQMKRRMSITNQRRLSIAKVSVQQTKYVSMAEAITNFHRVTPQRFHSTVKTTRTEQLRRQSFKLTRAQSPALMCKKRSRPVTALSREEQEKLELEKIRQNAIKANPVRKDILRKPAPLKKIEKKTITNPEPFHLTEMKKNQPPAPQKDIKRLHRVHTKTVPTIVSTTDKGVLIKDEEILHFGIPIEPSQCRKKNTKIIPFSFEARNKELQARKQERLRAIQEEEKHKVKAEFHARPVPAIVKTPMNKAAPKDDSIKKTKITVTRSLSFENRVKEVQKKKEERMKQVLEEEKKARIFKAHKVPEFKPVLVRGRSRDNLLKKSMENLSIKPSFNISNGNNKSLNIPKKIPNAELKRSHENLSTQSKSLIKPSLSIPFVAPKKITAPSKVLENQENHNRGAVPKILEPKCKISQKSMAILTELNTDKRAKQRKEFDEQLKKKEIEDEEKKKQDEEDRLVREKAEKLELRKQAEVKARPMPVYKPLNVVKSNKPLTEAQSPAWAKRKGSH
ncbi:targeting protein for Xklp2-like isoform X2 [Phymastichus coffea]|nr:targeting protein for Xklp2-like isoform X2 [Phymastichus coffea]